MIGGMGVETVGEALKQTDLFRKTQQVLKDKGISADKLPTKEELDRRTIEQANKSLYLQKQIVYSQQSLWPADIPLHFDFSMWKPDVQENIENAKKVGNKAYTLAKKLATDDFNVALVGAPGVGKTSLALAVLDYLKHHGKHVLFVSTTELVGLLEAKKEYKDLTQRIFRIEEAMKKVEVLMLDDFGTEGDVLSNNFNVRSDMQKIIYRVADSRFDFENNKIRHSTIVTTNNTNDELGRMYLPKIISRLVPREPEKRIVFNGFEDVRGV